MAWHPIRYLPLRFPGNHKYQAAHPGPGVPAQYVSPTGRAGIVSSPGVPHTAERHPTLPALCGIQYHSGLQHALTHALTQQEPSDHE